MKEVEAFKHSEGTAQQYLALHITLPQPHAVAKLSVRSRPMPQGLKIDERSYLVQLRSFDSKFFKLISWNDYTDCEVKGGALVKR